MKILINNNTFPYNLEKKINKLVVKPGNYNKLQDEEIKKIKIKLENNNNNNNIIISDALIRSIRSAYMNEREIKNHNKFIKNKKNLIKDYFKYKNIFKLSKNYDLSPIKILKYILEYHRLSKFNISLILNLSSKKNFSLIKKNFLLMINF